MSSFTSKFSKSIPQQIFALVLTTLAFFHESFRMQFWKDDYALLYNLQQKEPFYFPYQHLIDLHFPFFKVFGTNPLGYFTLGVLFVLISIILFYFLAYKLFSNKFLAFIASVAYVTTPVGIDNSLMAMTFATTYFMLCLFLTTLLLIVKFYEKKRLIYYFVGLLPLCLALELVPYRAFYLISVVVLFDLLNLRVPIGKVLSVLILKWRLNDKEKKLFKEFILRQLFLFFLWGLILYIVPVYILPGPLRYHPEQNATVIYKNFIESRLIYIPILSSVTAILGGFPYIFSQNFYVNSMVVLQIFFVSISIFSVYIFFRFKGTEKKLLKIYFFSLLYLYLTSLAFYAYSSREVMISANRYLVCAAPAYSLLIICIYLFLSKIFKNKKRLKQIPIAFLVFIVLINAITTQLYISDFNTRSFYSTEFSTQMKKYLPVLPKNSLLYFEPDFDPNMNYRLIDTYRGGHYDERAYFAVLYDMKQEDLNPVITDYKILLSNLKKKNTPLERVFAFHFGTTGLKDITKSIRKSITEKLNLN